MPIDNENIEKGLAYLMSRKDSEGSEVNNPTGRKGVVKDNAGAKLKKLLNVDPTLKSNEAARYTKVALLFKKVLFPKDEATRLQSGQTDKSIPVAAPSATIKQVNGGAPGDVLKGLGGVALLLGGLGALVAGLMSDGPAKGFLKILAKAGIGGGVKLLAGTFAKMGKFVGNIIKGFGGILLKPFKFFKGGKIVGVLGKIAGKLFKFLKPVLKRIPGIGSLISWAFAVSRFKKGDVVGGLIDVASGIATLFPGVGTAIGIGLDVLNAFLDMKKGKEGEGVKPAGSGFRMGDFFGKVKDKIMNNFPIKNLVEFWGGAQMVMSGNFKEGFQKMAFAVPFMKPLSDWLFNDREEVQPDGSVVKMRSIAEVMQEMILEKTKAGWASLPGWAKSFGRRVLPESFISAVDDGSPDMLTEAERAETGYQTSRATRMAKEKAWGDVESPGVSAIRQGIKGTDLENSEEWKYVQGAIPYLERLRKQHEVYVKAGNMAEAQRISIDMIKRERWKENALKYLYDRMPKNGPVMQDFIVQDGNVQPFSDKDSVIGLKTGGVIDQVINKSSLEIKKLNQQLVLLAHEQTQLLHEIAANTAAYLTANKQQAPVMVGGGNIPKPAKQLKERSQFTRTFK